MSPAEPSEALPARPAFRQLVSACFFLSGASCLVYEVVWMRQLLLTFGTTTAAVSTVLAAFMVGLALGAFWGGPLADRTRHPLWLYAGLELAIALYALLLPGLMSLASSLYVAAARGTSEHLATLTALRLGLGFLLLLAPTTLMGATLAVLARLAATGGRFGRDFGFLYGVNVWGAMLGSALTSFALIRWLGLQGATMFAVTLNLLVALLALLARPVQSALQDENALAERSPQPLEPPRVQAAATLWVIVFLSGFLTIAYEVLWTRILIFSFFSTVYSFGIILALFLAGLALGSWIFAALAARGRVTRSLLAGAQMLAALSVLACVPLSTRAQELLLRVASFLGPTGVGQLVGTALASSLVMLLPTTLMGIVFPLACRLLIVDLREAGRRVGAAYFVNTLGAVLGSLATGFALIPWLGLRNSLTALAAVQLAAAWPLLSRARLWPAVTASTLALAAGHAGLLRLLPGPSPFDPFAARSGVIEAHRDGASGSVSVVRQASGVRSLRIDGFEAAADEEGRYSYMAMMMHIPLLLHPDPRRVLVISFGTGTTAGTSLLYPEVQVDAVDINPTVFELAGHFRSVNRDVVRQPQARLIVNDGRNHLLVSREQYDVITSEPMPPTFAGMVNLYSREYYELARRHLMPGGLVVQWLPFHLLRLSESLDVLRTVQDVFPETSLWVHRKNGIIVARHDARLAIPLNVIRRHVQNIGVREDLLQRGLTNEAELVNLYVLGPQTIRAVTARARSVTDDRPSLEFHPPRHLLARSLGTTRGDEGPALEILYRLKREETLPLEGATPEEATQLQEFHRLSTYDLLGTLYLATGFLREARQEFEGGLRQARTPTDRALFLYELALLERESGEHSAARRLVEQILEVSPGYEPALRLRSRLDPS